VIAGKATHTIVRSEFDDDDTRKARKKDRKKERKERDR
jgi:hypothetical protein